MIIQFNTHCLIFLADLADGVYKEIFNVSVEESDDEGHHVETQRFVCITDRFVVEKDNAGKVSLHISVHALYM